MYKQPKQLKIWLILAMSIIKIWINCAWLWLCPDFPGGSAVKNPPASSGNMSSIPGSRRFPGEENGNLLQYSCLGNPMDRGTWHAVCEVAKESDRTWRLNNNTTLSMIQVSLARQVNPKIIFNWVEILLKYFAISSVQSLSRVRLFTTPWIAARQASLSITNSRSSHRLTSIESVMPSSYLILCRPLHFPPSIFSSIRVSSNESALCIRWPKY